MKIRQVMGAVGLTIAAWLAPGKAPQAAMIVYDSISIFQGQQGFTDSFSVTTPGTLTATVTAMPWLDTVNDLSFYMTGATGRLGSTLSGSGTESINIGQAGTYSANWFGNAQGLFDLGVVGVNIEFTPYATTVPLPASILLMLSALALLFAWPRIAPGVTPTSAAASLN